MVMKTTSIISILEKLMERLDDEDLEVVAMIARKIWLRRNTVVHIGDLLHSSNIVRSARESVKEFQNAEQSLRNNVKNDIAMTMYVEMGKVTGR
jgi:hypothetical protein